MLRLVDKRSSGDVPDRPRYATRPRRRSTQVAAYIITGFVACVIALLLVAAAAALVRLIVWLVTM